MKCNAAPFEGTDNYLFFGFCRTEAERLYPLLERLSIEGFNVWYDNGTYPNEQLSGMIEERIKNAKACVIAASAAFAESHICRSQVNLAFIEKKPLAFVVLEDFPTTLGLRLQLASTRCIPVNGTLEDKLYATLAAIPAFAACRKAGCNRNHAALQSWKQRLKKKEDVEDDPPEPNQESEPPLEPTRRIKPTPKPEPRSGPEPKSGPKPEPEPKPQLTSDLTIPNSSSIHTVRRIAYYPAMLVRIKTGKISLIEKRDTVVGRLKGAADIDFSDNKEISGRHIKIVCEGEKYLLHNLKPTNATVLNGRKLAGEECAELATFSVITLSDEQLIFLYGDMYDRVFDEQKIYLLCSKDTGELKMIPPEGLFLDRNHKEDWRGDILNDRRISRAAHVSITFDHNRYYVQQIKAEAGKPEHNPSYLNGKRLEPGNPMELHDGDNISVVDTAFLYREIKTGG